MILCAKSVTRLQNKTITSMWNTFSVCLFHSAEITEAISLALRSVSHALENFSGFISFHSIPNGKNLTRFLLFYLHLYSANHDYRLQNYIFLTNLKTYKTYLTGETEHEWTTSKPRDHGDAGVVIGHEHREYSTHFHTLFTSLLPSPPQRHFLKFPRIKENFSRIKMMKKYVLNSWISFLYFPMHKDYIYNY